MVIIMSNPFGKTRSESEPYAIYGNSQGWIWKVLKTYKKPQNEKNDLMLVGLFLPLLH